DSARRGLVDGGVSGLDNSNISTRYIGAALHAGAARSNARNRRQTDGKGLDRGRSRLGTLDLMRRQIDYRLARRAVLREWRMGKVGRAEVCDAHPELVRAARHLGEATTQECPICEKSNLRLVSYVYGDSLKAANG